MNPVTMAYSSTDNPNFLDALSSNISNVTSAWGPEPSELPKSSQIPLIILYTLATGLAVTGNITVILVFTFGKRSRTDLRLFLINLAVSDLIMAFFCLPFTFTTQMLDNWILPAIMCPMILYMQTVAVTASVCTNMAIGMDRFWVVHFPLKSRITKSRSKFVIIIIWVIACGLSSIQLFIGKALSTAYAPNKYRTECIEIWWEPSELWRRSYTFFLLILTYFLPLSILAFTYSFVAVRLWRRTAPGNADEVRDTQQLRSKRKVIKMLVVVVIFFGICWLPLHTFSLFLDYNPSVVINASKAQMQRITAFYYSAHWLAMSNSFVNPIIYGFLNDSFRNDLKRLWRRWFPCCRQCPCLYVGAYSESTILVKNTHATYYTRKGSGGCPNTVSSTSHRSANDLKRNLVVKINGNAGITQTEVAETHVNAPAVESLGLNGEESEAKSIHLLQNRNHFV